MILWLANMVLHLPAMLFYECGVLLIYTSLSMASFEFHRLGWLDKVVEYHKNKLFEDFRKVSDVEIKATIQPAPEGYVDSSAWDFDSVSRLLILIRQSKTTLPVRRVLRRMLGNTRRKMTFQETFRAFPSLSKDLPDDIYYDVYPGDTYGDLVTEVAFVEEQDQGIILVSNPVEARLPSAMISISLLRKILEERGKAARHMGTTAKTIPWKSMTKATSTKSATNATKHEGGVTSTGYPEGQTGSSGNTEVTAAVTAADQVTTDVPAAS